MRTWMALFFSVSSLLGPSINAQEVTLEERVVILEGKLSEMETRSGTTLNGYWKNGFHLETPDKQFRLQLGGRVQFDTAFFQADKELEEAKDDFIDGMKFRRARMYMKGTIYDNVEFVAEYDFAGSLAFRNVFIGLKEIPVIGNVRVGHILEPVSLEDYSSNNYVTFMERGFPTAFTPSYNSGIMAFDSALDKRMTWAAGIFKDTGSLGDSSSNEAFAVTARITGLPFYEAGGRRYAHLGSSISHRNQDEPGYRIRSRPDSSIAPYVVDTKGLDADSVLLNGFEGLLTLDAWSLESEWIMSSVDLNPGEEGGSDNADFSAYYVMVSYFLTGEYRPYNQNSGTMGRITPNQNVQRGSLRGGAWEVAARYAGIDLTDQDVTGGEMTTYTLGLNWYLNPHTRVMWNYVMADVKDEGDADIFQMRFQIDF